MKYYSNSLDEVKEKLKQKESKSRNTRNISRLLLFLDLILILLVVVIYRDKIPSNNDTKHLNKKVITIANQKLEIQCKIKKNICFLTSKEALSNLQRFTLQWFVAKPQDDHHKKQVLYTENQVISKKETEYLFNIPQFNEANIFIYVRFLNKDKEEIISLQVYP